MHIRPLCTPLNRRAWWKPGDHQILEYLEKIFAKTSRTEVDIQFVLVMQFGQQ